MAKAIASMSMLVLHILGIFVAIASVKACHAPCTPSPTLCLCDRRNITSLDSLIVSPSLTFLKLNNNKITTISKSTFANLTQLRYLHLSHNKITTISQSTFAYLTQLRNLWLEANMISEIQPYAFATQMNLQILFLNDNQITTISQSTFANLTRLTQLHLNHNMISEIQPYAFARLLILKNLPLFNNKITTISQSTFANLTQLSNLQLQNNMISEIQPYAFATLLNLNTLNIQNNLLALDTTLCSLLPIYIRDQKVIGVTNFAKPTCNVDIQCYDFPNRPQKAFCPCTSGMVYDGKQCSMPVVSSCLLNTTLPATPCTLPPNCTSNGHVFSCYCPLGTYLNNDQCDSANLTIVNIAETAILLAINTDSYRFPENSSTHLQVVAQSSSRRHDFKFLISSKNRTVEITGLATGTEYEISIPNTYFTNIKATPNSDEGPSDDSGNGPMTNPSTMTTAAVTTNADLSNITANTDLSNTATNTDSSITTANTDSSNTTANTDSSNTTAVAVGVSMGVLLIAAVGVAILVKTRKFSQLGELKNNFLQAGMSSHALTKAASVVRMSTSKLSRQFSGAASKAETLDDTSKCGAPVTYENQENTKVGLINQTSVGFFMASAEEKNSYETVSQADNQVNEAKQVETNLNTTGTDQHEAQSGELGCAISSTSSPAQTNGRA